MLAPSTLSSLNSVPPTLPTSTSSAALRILQYLAVGQNETHEAAIAELGTASAVAAEIADLCAPVTGTPLGSGAALDFGASVYALAPGRTWPGGPAVDVVCLGAPMWIRAVGE